MLINANNNKYSGFKNGHQKSVYVVMAEQC